MSPEIYQFDIARAGHAADLHVLRHEIVADDTLTADEKAVLLEAIRLKFRARHQRDAAPSHIPTTPT